MKTTRLVLGLTGSILVLICAVKLAFFGQEMIPVGSVSRFNPDAFVIFISGLLGLFGAFIGTAGSVLCLWDSELSGIMLLGSAVSCAVMLGAVIILFSLTKNNIFHEYPVLAAGITAFIALAFSGAVTLKARQTEPENGLGNENI